MNNKLLYIANIRLPTEKAHGNQIMEMCAAFVDQNVKVELIVPNRRNEVTGNPFDYHDIRPIFTIRKLPCVDLVRFGRIGFLVESFTFTVSAVLFSFFRKDVIFYTRDETIALCLRLIMKQVVWEGHTGQKNLIARIVLRLNIPVVVITQALRDLYLSLGLASSKIMVSPDGADINRFNINMTQTEARKELGLPQDKKIALYKGHLYEWKGAHTLARAATCLSTSGVICVFIGGTKEDVVAFRNLFGENENIYILGNRPRKETPIYQKAADLLIIPNSAKDDVSKLYTSPMKLFAYMASGVPIIASDLPSLREIIDDSLAYFFKPDDSNDLCAVVRDALRKYDDAKKKSAAALALAEEYSWDKRAANIIGFISLQKLI